MNKVIGSPVGVIIAENINTNKKISFLGVTFKPNTDDMRDSTSLKMIPYVSK